MELFTDLVFLKLESLAQTFASTAWAQVLTFQPLASQAHKETFEHPDEARREPVRPWGRVAARRLQPQARHLLK